jgi:hypothetical protein
LTETEGLWTVSGRSDCPPTSRSNVGFNKRVLDEEVALSAMPGLVADLADEDAHFVISLKDALNGSSRATAVLDRIYGNELRALMLEGLGVLANEHPAVTAGAPRLVGPTLEGVGWYPRLTPDLRIPGSSVWVPGDAGGRFRGIVAGMISGHYVGSAVLSEMEDA